MEKTPGIFSHTSVVKHFSEVRCLKPLMKGLLICRASNHIRPCWIRSQRLSGNNVRKISQVLSPLSSQLRQGSGCLKQSFKQPSFLGTWMLKSLGVITQNKAHIFGNGFIVICLLKKNGKSNEDHGLGLLHIYIPILLQLLTWHDAFTIHFPVSKIRTAYICSSELFDIWAEACKTFHTGLSIL